ncbi:MAG: iron uptake protein [Methylibium sp.]|uniref:iron uptake protein n=1 Tax=Methylibium sp. TaxID=2067992 RepID=UPI0017984AAF|nr:iron uptake protein [Methylibium sp.]MBA3597300.1 iron uptake protein [Methylibium sp.]
MVAATLAPPRVVSRIAASLLGGWLFTWGFVALGISLGVAAGMPYHEAQTLLFLLAFLVFLGLFLWAFAAASVVRVWLVLAGGGASMTALSWVVSRALA